MPYPVAVNSKHLLSPKAPANARTFRDVGVKSADERLSRGLLVGVLKEVVFAALGDQLLLSGGIADL